MWCLVEWSWFHTHMDQNCRLGISLHAKKVPSTSTLFQFNSILFQCLSCLACAQFAWTASKYKFISTMSSIQDAQQSVTVRFSFMACFTWCTTAPKVDPPIHFLIIRSAHNLLIAAPASQHREFYFGSYRPLHFCHFSHAWVLLCLDMFHSQCPIHLLSFHSSMLLQAQ